MFSFIQATLAQPKHFFTLWGARMGAETPEQDSFLHRGSAAELQVRCQVQWHVRPQGRRTSSSFCAAPATETTQ